MSILIRTTMFVVTFLFCLFSVAITPAELPWQSGQILGISSRAGLTPVLVQLTTHSMIDHVGLVVVENDQAWLYEFVNANGFQRTKIQDLWDRSKDSKNEVHFVLAETDPALTEEEFRTVKSRFDHWIDPHVDANFKPKSCHESMQSAFAGIRAFPPQLISPPEHLPLFLEGLIAESIKKAYGEAPQWPVMSSVFKHLKKIKTNLPEPFLWNSDLDFLTGWKERGDFTKLARMRGIQNRLKLADPQALEDYKTRTINDLEKTIKMYSPLCRIVLGAAR